MDSLAKAQIAIANRDFFRGLLRRVALCVLLFLPLLLLFGLVNGKIPSPEGAAYTAYLLALILALSLAFDYAECLAMKARISRRVPGSAGEAMCFAVLFDRESKGTKKRYGYLVRSQGMLGFFESKKNETTTLGRFGELRIRESEKYYLRDPYSPRKRKIRSLVEIEGDKTWVFDTLASAEAVASLTSREVA